MDDAEHEDASFWEAVEAAAAASAQARRVARSRLMHAIFGTDSEASDGEP